MAKVFTISKAFQSKNRDTGELDVVKTDNGEFHKFMFQVEGQNKPGWMQKLVKVGSTLEVGDELYGIIDEWDNGNAKWQKVDKPADIQLKRGSGAAQPARAQSSQPNGSVEEKLDFIISMLENFLNTQKGAKPAQRQADTVLEDIDDGPIDLSGLPY